MNARRVTFLAMALLFAAAAMAAGDGSALQIAAGVAALSCLVLGGASGSGGAAGG